MSDQQVDPAAVSVWRWEAMIVAAIITLGSAIPLAPLSLALSGAIATVIAICAFHFAWWWPAARYRHLSYALDDIGLSIREGVFWRAQIALPRVRIQHSDVSQGPLQRRYGIATLKLYTAGSRYTKVELDGLQHEDALALRDALLNRAASNV